MNKTHAHSFLALYPLFVFFPMLAKGFWEIVYGHAVVKGIIVRATLKATARNRDKCSDSTSL